MLRTRHRAPRPVLLLLVYGAFLAVVGIAATAQSVLVGAHFSTAALNAVVSSDAAATRVFLGSDVRPADLAADAVPSDAALDRLEARLAAMVGPAEILRVELRRQDGTIVAASAPGLRGVAIAPDSVLSAALAGEAQASIEAAQGSGAGPGDLGSPTIIRELLPVMVDGHVLGVVGIWRDAVPILDRLEGVRREIIVVTVSAGLVAAILLFLIFRSAQGRLTRQTAALVEATRRDPLTGTLNHGALVASLAAAIEAARLDGHALGIALLDIDNFRLLNDTHGHAAGDDALVAVASRLAETVRPDMVMGRYGPDEFLLVAPPEAVASIEPIVQGLRDALVDISLRFADTERLPVTVSAAIATYPEHASSVTGLLATAAQVLEEAKGSGGDTVRVAGRPVVDPVGTSGFDVLHGLVIAIDTKDRYTKRHSEDVARYATFLARRIGRPKDELRTLSVAGLLHDVGKIGIPDHILRKPGKLTDAEFGIVQQHVALGDIIVRDLPDIELIRAGIRHHHERWDGKGYLHGLAGDDIPLIARILAIADAFSAMTTSRPYRKALDLREALTRLGDAAGTQLDEVLVTAFIEGIEHDEDAPLPGMDVPPNSLWLPGRQVA